MFEAFKLKDGKFQFDVCEAKLEVLSMRQPTGTCQSGRISWQNGVLAWQKIHKTRRARVRSIHVEIKENIMSDSPALVSTF